jgi:hypothetical protein
MIERVLTRDELPTNFLGLTFPDDCMCGLTEDSRARKVHRDLQTIKKRLLRRWPDLKAYVRIEWKERKSGEFEGYRVPHAHLLLYRGPSCEVLRMFMVDNWPEVIGTKDASALKVLMEPKAFQDFRGDIRMVQNYLSKYIAKVSECLGFNTGRHWLEWGDISKCESIVIEMSCIESKIFKRVLRHWCRLRSRRWDLVRQLERGMSVMVLIGSFWIYRMIDFAADLAEVPF